MQHKSTQADLTLKQTNQPRFSVIDGISSELFAILDV